MFGDMGKMLKQVTEMKSKMAAVESELKKTLVQGLSKDNSIEIELTGKMKLSKVVVHNVLADKKALERAIYEAVDKALTDVTGIAQKKLSEATGGLSIPGL